MPQDHLRRPEADEVKRPAQVTSGGAASIGMRSRPPPVARAEGITMREQVPERSMRIVRPHEECTKISTAFIRLIRGDQSQKTLSRRLGYTSNVVYQWEAGRRIPDISDVMRAALLRDLSEHGRKFAQRLQTGSQTSELVKEMTVGLSLTQLAEAMEISLSTLSRWRAGAISPNVVQFFQLFDLSTGRLLEMLAMFVDPAHIEVVAQEWRNRLEIREIANLMPLFIPILCAIDLDEYKQLKPPTEAWLAARLGQSPREVSYVLQRMCEAGAIVRQGGCWVASNVLNDLFLAGADTWQQLKLQPEMSGLVAGAVSKQTHKAITLASQAFLLHLDELLRHDSGHKEEIVFANFQMTRIMSKPPS